MLGLIIAFQSAYQQQHNSTVTKSIKQSLTRLLRIDELKKSKHLRDTVIVKPKKKKVKKVKEVKHKA